MEMLMLDRLPRRVLATVDLQRAFIVSRVIVAAERLQLFRALQGRPTSADQLGRTLNIHTEYRDAFLNSLVGL